MNLKLHKEVKKIFIMLVAYCFFYITRLYLSPSRKPPKMPAKPELNSLLHADNKLGQRKGSVKNGELLFYDKYLGNNEKSCAICHASSKYFPQRVHLYPIYSEREKKNILLIDRIVGCIQGALDGPKLDKTDMRLYDLEAYIKYLYDKELKDELGKQGARHY